MAYNLLDLQTAIADDLNDPSFSAGRLTRYINYAQSAIFNQRIFKFCEKAVSGALTIGSAQYNQQADHQSTIGGVLIDPGNTRRMFELNKDTYVPNREFFDRYPVPLNEPTSMPVAWTEYATQFYFNCPVDKAYSFNQRYYKTPTALTLPTDVPSVPEAFRELIESYATAKAEQYRGNFDVAKAKMESFDEGLEAMSLRFSPAISVAPAKMAGATRRVQ